MGELRLRKLADDRLGGAWPYTFAKLGSSSQTRFPSECFRVYHGTHAVYPTGNNPSTGLPWAPATAGLRNLTGVVNQDGTVTIYAVTATVSGNGDQGADPNRVVVITHALNATALPANESFTTFRSAGYGEVLRAVSLAPTP